MAETVQSGDAVRRWFARFEGMGPFGLIWLGQAITLLGSKVMQFAFIIRAWVEGGQATQVIALSLASMLPRLLVSPTAGALVDRMDRRSALRMADLGGLAVVGGLTAVYFAGDLRLWYIYLSVVLASCFDAFAVPALSATVPLLVRKEQLQRANGLLSTARSTAEVGGPALGGLLVTVSGLGLILWLNLASFVFALAMIQIVPITTPPRDGPGKARKKILADSAEGLRLLFARAGLRDLVVIFFTVNLTMVLGLALLRPLILARSGNDAAALAVVTSAIGIGGIVGGLLLGAWGGPKDRVRGMLLGTAGVSVTGLILMAVVRGTPGWVVAGVLSAGLLPLVNSTVTSLVQAKVPPQQLGRVFGAVVFVSQIAAPLAMIVSAPLADHVFEPQARSDSGLVGFLGPLVGHGPGAGMAAMLLIAGVLGTAVALGGFARRNVRDLDVIMPDLTDDEETATEPAKTGG